MSATPGRRRHLFLVEVFISTGRIDVGRKAVHAALPRSASRQCSATFGEIRGCRSAMRGEVAAFFFFALDSLLSIATQRRSTGAEKRRKENTRQVARMRYPTNPDKTPVTKKTERKQGETPPLRPLTR
jgi:hypothetical protein